MHVCIVLDVYLDSTNFGCSLVSHCHCLSPDKYRDRGQERRVLVGSSAIVPEWKKKIDQEMMLHNHKVKVMSLNWNNG